MKRIVFLTYSDNVFTQNYIKELLKTGDFKITVIGFQHTRWMAFYKKHHIRYIDVPRIYLPEQSSIKDYIRYLRARLFIFLNRNRFDFIHVQSVVENSLKHAKMLMGRRGKLILTYWGGDIFSKSNEQFRREKCYLDCAYKINVLKDEMRDILNQKYQLQFNDKCRVFSFGNTNISIMKRYLEKYGKTHVKRIARKYFGMPEDKVVIAVGYSARPQQQHIKVIDQIKMYPAHKKEQIFLYCHMSYGQGGADYVQKVDNALKKSGCQYKINADYVKPSELAMMKLGTDIFVHAGTYDSLSESMLEYIYAGKKVFNPSWIEYDMFQQLGIQDIKYNDFEDLEIKLLDAVSAPYWDQSTEEQNRQGVSKLCDWDLLLPKWLELYE